jgi:hypothetical protein
MIENVFQAMLSKLAKDPAVMESVAGDPKAELWYERQEIKRWYEERIEGLPGDEYITRCTRMLDWWLEATEGKDEAKRLFTEFARENEEDVGEYKSNNNAESDIQALQALLSQSYRMQDGDIRWRILCQAVAECAVGSLIEINEEISESVESESLSEHFVAVRDFWDSFYDLALAEGPEAGVRAEGSHGLARDESVHGAEANASGVAADSSTSSSAVFKKSMDNALETIQAGLDDKKHEVNNIGGFSQLEDDFRYLAVLLIAIQGGHLTREGLLLYSCLYSYCITFLRRFFIILRNDYLSENSVEPSEEIEELIEESSHDMIAELQNEIEKRTQTQFNLLNSKKISAPAAFRTSFEKDLSDAIDMALATLQEAVKQSIAMEEESGIEIKESFSAVIQTYSPLNLHEFEDSFRQSPWKFHDLSSACTNVLEQILPEPRGFLEQIFSQWRDEGKTVNGGEYNTENMESADKAPTRMDPYLPNQVEAFNEFRVFLDTVLRRNVAMQDYLRGNSALDTLVFAQSKGHVRLLEMESLMEFIQVYELEMLLKNTYSSLEYSTDQEELSSPTQNIVRASHSHGPLTGERLIEKVSSCVNQTPADQALACGYFMRNKPEMGDVEAFYAALYEAYRARKE